MTILNKNDNCESAPDISHNRTSQARNKGHIKKSSDLWHLLQSLDSRTEKTEKFVSFKWEEQECTFYFSKIAEDACMVSATGIRHIRIVRTRSVLIKHPEAMRPKCCIAKLT